MKCDECGKDYLEYDLERMMFARGRVKYICYKCRAKANREASRAKIASMEKYKIIGEKIK